MCYTHFYCQFLSLITIFILFYLIYSEDYIFTNNYNFLYCKYVFFLISYNLVNYEVSRKYYIINIKCYYELCLKKYDSNIVLYYTNEVLIFTLDNILRTYFLVVNVKKHGLCNINVWTRFLNLMNSIEAKWTTTLELGFNP